LIEPKPFTADLSRALGGLQEEIAKAIVAKKEEESVLKRQEKQIQDLKKLNEQLQEKANIKLSVKEMMSAGSEPAPATGKLSEDVQRRLSFLGEQLHEKDERIKSLESLNERFAKENNAFVKLKEGILGLLPAASPVGSNPASLSLQRVVTIVDLESVKKSVPAFTTDTVKGKLASLAKEGFFENWKSISDVQARIDELAWGPITGQALNGALGDLVKDCILGMRHTDRNRWRLAPDVIFKDGKGVSGS
jgi:hypothetical protein